MALMNKLITIVDADTNDEHCRSVQTILTHVVRSGFNYAVAINRLKKAEESFRDFVWRNDVSDYIKDLDRFFQYTEEVLGQFTDKEIEEPDNSKKILTRWDQRYDIEQLMEHAIVHILRHRRQIEKFLIKLVDIVHS